MAESKPVDLDAKAKPVEAGKPVEMPSILGATFAERAAAKKKADTKQVDTGQVEDKAVKAAESKRPARKKS